jgi:hypothetical protein
MNIGDIGNKYFLLADLGDLNLGAAAGAKAVSVSVGGAEIFAESLYADSDGSVYLRDLCGLLQPYMPTSGVASVSITSGDFSASMKVLVCASQTTDWEDFGADEWANSHFLNTVTDRVIGDSVSALLYVVSLGSALSSCPVDVEARYLGEDGEWHTQSFILSTVTAKADVVTTVAASPSSVLAGLKKVAPTAQRLSGYFVTVGLRKARFLIDSRRTPYCVSFSFLNAFGLREWLPLYGESVAKRAYTLTNAVINGRLQAVNPVVEIDHTVTASVISASEAEMVTELLASDNVMAYINNGWRQVVFTEVEYEPSSAFDAVNEAKFTYRIAKKNHRFAAAEAGGSRVFGNEFDETFE